jgi:hypothetical protein
MRKLLQAIELNLTEFRTEARHRWHRTDELIRDHHETLYGDGNGSPGLRMRTDRLEQRQSRRDQHFWVMWTAVIGTICGTIWAWISGQKP